MLENLQNDVSKSQTKKATKMKPKDLPKRMELIIPESGALVV